MIPPTYRFLKNEKKVVYLAALLIYISKIKFYNSIKSERNEPRYTFSWECSVSKVVCECHVMAKMVVYIPSIMGIYMSCAILFMNIHS